MDLRDFQYFIAIAETGSFSKAAMAHTIAQSALSRRIRDLEADLGVSLFYRNGRGVVVTEAGATFLTRARSILADVAQIRSDLNASHATLQGVVTLGVPPSVGLVLLAPLLSQIRNDFPGIQMRVLEGFSGYVAEWLASGRVDLAVLYKVRAGTFPDAEHLLFEDMHLISSRHARAIGQGATVALRDLVGEDLALPGAPHGLRILVDEACARAQVSLSVAMELETLPTIREHLDSDLQAAFDGDPAAHSVDEVLVCYPGIAAMINHRLAHQFYRLELPLIARIIAEIAHSATGIDIHPGAKIGKSFFIDHGTGVVIGETTIIGERVRLYQAVTLGAKRFPTDENGVLIKGNDRHPILEDDVVVYAGATILGRITIGKGSTIGGNVWVTRSVPPNSNITQAAPRQDFFEHGAGI
jgi:serine O-acetyltransferase